MNDGLAERFEAITHFEQNQDLLNEERFLGKRGSWNWPIERAWYLIPGITAAMTLPSAGLYGALLNGTGAGLFCGGFKILDMIRNAGLDKQKPMGRVEEPEVYETFGKSAYADLRKNLFPYYAFIASAVYGTLAAVCTGAPALETMLTAAATSLTLPMIYFGADRLLAQGSVPGIGDKAKALSLKESQIEKKFIEGVESSDIGAVLTNFDKKIKENYFDAAQTLDNAVLAGLFADNEKGYIAIAEQYNKNPKLASYAYKMALDYASRNPDVEDKYKLELAKKLKSISEKISDDEDFKKKQITKADEAIKLYNKE
jgi:hypothetical protein